MLIATLMMAAMYTFLVFGIAELSAAISTAGGGYGFARRPMGPLGGFLTGTVILLEYAIAAAALVVFILGMIPQFAFANLTVIAVNEAAIGACSFLREGYVGTWAAIPFAMWLCNLSAVVGQIEWFE